MSRRICKVGNLVRYHFWAIFISSALWLLIVMLASCSGRRYTQKQYNKAFNDGYLSGLLFCSDHKDRMK